MAKKNQSSKFSKIRLLLIVGILLLLTALVGPFSWSTSKSPLTFEALYKPHPNDYRVLPGGKAPSNLEDQALRLYSQGRFDQALILFDEIIRKAQDENLLLFRACILLEKEQYQTALADLQQISVASKYYHPSLWYQVLIHLKLNNAEKARDLLQSYLALRPDFKLSEARRLLKKLSSES